MNLKKYKLVLVCLVVFAWLTMGTGIGVPVSADGMIPAAALQLPVTLPTVSPVPTAASVTSGSPGLMHITKAQHDEINAEVHATLINASRFHAMVSPPASFSLLSYVPYVPADRDQGSCANCWVWASTGALETQHNFSQGVSDRLSIQWFNWVFYNAQSSSLGDNLVDQDIACNGGSVDSFVKTYNNNNIQIPWSNTNAFFADGNCGDPGKGTCTFAITAWAMAQTPSYSQATPLSYYSINTSSRSDAISAIKSSLLSGHPVVYTYYLQGNQSSGDWSHFYDFYFNKPEKTTWDPTPYDGDSADGGHVVLIVGYDTTDPNNPYWIVLNSWGAPDNRPDGTFRLTMNTNYGSLSSDGDPQYTFQIINSDFNPVRQPAVETVEPMIYGFMRPDGSVTINGMGFTGATAVHFGTKQADAFAVTSDSTITATAPVQPPGIVDVTVTGPGGTSATEIPTKTNQYFYMLPTITGVSPDLGTPMGGNSVTITGENFSAATEIDFGNTISPGETIINDTTIVATAPPAPEGARVDLRVLSPVGTSEKTPADSYTYYQSLAITSITPLGGLTQGGDPVVIKGAGFTGATAVSFGNVSVPAGNFTVVGDSEIDLTSPPHAAGTVNVTVTTPWGVSAATTATQQFRYVGTPMITRITPLAGPVSGGNTLTVYGSGFKQVNFYSVSFGPVTEGTPFTNTVNVINDTTLTVTVPAGHVPAGHYAGFVNIILNTNVGQSAVDDSSLYTYQNVPAITGISPDNGPTYGDNQVSVSGSDFVGITMASPYYNSIDDLSLWQETVYFGTKPATYTHVLNDTAIAAGVPPGTAGTVDVTLSTFYPIDSDGTMGPPYTTTATSAADEYTYTQQPGIVTKVSPSYGPVAGGNAVTIKGLGFTGATSVTFDNQPAPSFTVNNDTSITAIAPAGIAGVNNVQVTTPGGTSAEVAGDQYTYYLFPVVTGVSPASGPVTGGTNVTITGTGLYRTKEVQFGGYDATNVTVVPTCTVPIPFTDICLFGSGNAVTATSPADIMAGGSISELGGTVDVQVFTPGGISSENPPDDTFGYTAPLESGPPPGIARGGLNVTSRPPGAEILVGGTTTHQVTPHTFENVSPNDYTVAVRLNGYTPASKTVTVRSNQMTPVDFALVPVPKTASPAPGVTAVFPAAGMSGTQVQIAGSGFTGATAVSFGATPAASFTITSDTSITATAPAGIGVMDIAVSTPAGTSALSPADQFTYYVQPSVTGVSPADGPAGVTTGVTISGTNLFGATAVNFGGTPAVSFSVTSNSAISATAPPGSAGTVDVTVVTPGGTSAVTPADSFTRGVLPVAAFTKSAQFGYPPFSVTFTDLSQNADLWSWNFGDGTLFNTTDPAQKSPVHIYYQAGNYSAVLTTCNPYGCNST